MVTPGDRRRVEAIIGNCNAPQKHVWARQNHPCSRRSLRHGRDRATRSGKAKPVVWRWQARFMAEGVAGLTRGKTRKPASHRSLWPPCGGGSKPAYGRFPFLRFRREWGTMVHGTSNTRTPNSFGFGASHGDALKTVCAVDMPCCHSLCIEERLKS
jgi:hypothetical protein